MKLADLLATGAIRVPWPTQIGDTKIEGDRHEAIFCEKHCPKRVCVEGQGTRLGKTCHSGFTYYQASIGDAPVVVYGVLGAGGWLSIPKSIREKFKADLKGRGVTATQFQDWVDSLGRAADALDADRDQIISEALHPLHETPKIAEEIRNLAEATILRYPGKNIDEKFQAAAENEKSVYRAATLLVDSFDMLTIFFNPASAKLGAPRVVEPYKLIDKLTRLANFNRVGGTRKNILLRGSSFRKYDLYESFHVIPMALLNNAVKYSFADEIVVEITDQADKTCVEIKSTGPLIEPSEIDSIFLRGARGIHGRKVDNQGMGIGLYVAKLAAQANGLTISASSIPAHYMKNGVPVAENKFSFFVRDIRR